MGDDGDSLNRLFSKLLRGRTHIEKIKRFIFKKKTDFDIQIHIFSLLLSA